MISRSLDHFFKLRFVYDQFIKRKAPSAFGDRLSLGQDVVFHVTNLEILSLEDTRDLRKLR